MTEWVDKKNKPSWLQRLGTQENINFVLTNRVPRIALTRLMGAISRIKNPVFTRLAISLWRQFTDLDLSEARQTHFESIQACFTRELKADARPIDARPDVLASPCDAIVGASGTVHAGTVLQAKGMAYRLAELTGKAADVVTFDGGSYVTLRLTSAMYHRFHAPHDAQVESVTHIPGDTFNVNPIAVKRIARLFCRNERAVLRLRTAQGGWPIALVPVAAILVAGLRLRFLDLHTNLRDLPQQHFDCAHQARKGDELGWFEHGSTIVVLAPAGFALADGVQEGDHIRMGQGLMRCPNAG